MLKYIRQSTAIIIAVVVTLCAGIVCGAAGASYTISELDEMNITLPETMSAITRNSERTDRYFSVFGLDYESVMQNFKSGNIYLQGMNTDSSLSVTVTMTKSEESEGITNYNLLSKEKLGEVQTNFLSQPEYISCTPDESKDKQAVWLLFNTNVNSNGKNYEMYQAHTIFDGMSINITLQRNTGNVGASDFAIFSNIVSSVSFEKKAQYNYLMPIIFVGAGVIVLILIIIMILAIKRSGKKRKSKKNDRILSELADKYGTKKNLKNKKSEKSKSAKPEYFTDKNTKISKLNTGTAESDKKPLVDISAANAEAESSSYIDTAMFEENLEQQFKDDYLGDSNPAENKIYDKNKPVGIVSDAEIDEIISTAHSFETNPDKVVYSEALDVSKSRFEKIIPFSTEENSADDAKSEDTEQPVENAIDKNDVEEELDLTEDGLTEDEEFINDEELVREQVRKVKFTDSDDFFEEAPLDIAGILSNKELNEAEDFDVISEIEKKATKVESETDEVEDVDQGISIAERMQKISEGVKYFFVHCGYFCQNVHRLIKRKKSIAKRKKLEEERRQLARRRAEGQRKQRIAAENGSLVQVHSRTDKRPPQSRSAQSRNRTLNSSRRGSSQNNRPRRK